MVGEDRARVLAWMGELHGREADLRRIAGGDASVIHSLNAQFALALWNASSRELTLAGDRYGNQPLYLARNGTRFCFGSSAAAVGHALGMKPELDPEVFGELAWLGRPIGERTLFKDISRLPPATVVRVTDKEESAEAYWRPRFRCTGSRARALSAAADAFVAAVERLTREKEVVASLTGGQDTRAILAAALSLGRRVPVFTAGVSDGCDFGVARRLARRAGVRFTGLMLDRGLSARIPRLAQDLVRVTDGAVGPRHAHLACLAEFCASRSSALVDGGAAEFTKRGFLRRAGRACRSQADLAGVAVEACGKPSTACLLLGQRQSLRVKSEIRTRFEALLAEVRQPTVGDALDALFLRFDWPSFGAPGVAAHAELLELRLPFLDYDYVDAVTRVPVALREASAIQDAVVRRLHSSLAFYPRVFCDIVVPWPDRPLFKYPAVFIDRMLSRAGLPIHLARPCFPAWCWRDAGLENAALAALDRGLLDGPAVDRVRAGRSSGRRFPHEAALLLWQLEMWHRAFVDGAEQDSPAEAG